VSQVDASCQGLLWADAGHGGECRTPEALTDRRERLTERRREKTLVTPEARFRWNRAYKFKLMGLTPERFAQMLEARAAPARCAGSRSRKGQRICIDHDHECDAECVAAPGRGASLIPGDIGSRDPVEERERRGDDRE
jgi:hypothetical protein